MAVKNKINSVNLKSGNYFGNQARDEEAKGFQCSSDKYDNGGCPDIYGHLKKYTIQETKCGMFVTATIFNHNFKFYNSIILTYLTILIIIYEAQVQTEQVEKSNNKC
jgi:hypothetical protein